MENQNEPSQTSPQSTTPQPSNLPSQSLPENKPHSSFLTNKLFLITVVILILFTIVYSGIYLSLGSQLDKISKPSPTPLPAETSVKEGDPTANWKTYRNLKLRIELKYPEEYQISRESENKITVSKDRLGSGGFWILNKNDSGFVSLSSLKTCKEVYEEIKKNPGDRPSCLDVGKSFGQDQDIANLKLGGTDAISFYSTSTGQGGTFRIVQTIKEPFIEIYFFNDTVSNKKF